MEYKGFKIIQQEEHFFEVALVLDGIADVVTHVGSVVEGQRMIDFYHEVVWIKDNV